MPSFPKLMLILKSCQCILMWNQWCPGACWEGVNDGLFCLLWYNNGEWRWCCGTVFKCSVILQFAHVKMNIRSSFTQLLQQLFIIQPKHNLIPIKESFWSPCSSTLQAAEVSDYMRSLYAKEHFVFHGRNKESQTGLEWHEEE